MSVQTKIRYLGCLGAGDLLPLFEVDFESFNAEFGEVGGKKVVDGPSE